MQISIALQFISNMLLFKRFEEIFMIIDVQKEKLAQMKEDFAFIKECL